MGSRPTYRRRSNNLKGGNDESGSVSRLACWLWRWRRPASAQDKYPSKPVKIIVPYAPGGATDIAPRLSASSSRPILGQSFVVENKPGAFGIWPSRKWRVREPDGYTLMSAT